MKQKILAASLGLVLCSGASAASLYEGALEDRLAKLEAMVEGGQMQSAVVSDNNLYGSIRIAFRNVDNDGGVDGDGNLIGDSSRVDGDGSRFGFRGSHEIAPGLTGVYRLEWGLEANQDLGIETDDGVEKGNSRLGYIGLRGSLGEVQIGETWNPAYNYVGVLTDTAANGGGIGQLYLGGFRVDNAINYAHKVGNTEFGALAQIGQDLDDEGVSQWEAGFSTKVGIATLAAYYATTNAKAEVADAAAADQHDSDGYGYGVSFNASKDVYLAADYTDIDSDNNAFDQSAYTVVAVIDVGDASKKIRLLYTDKSTENVTNEEDQTGNTDISGYQVGFSKQYSQYRLDVSYSEKEEYKGPGKPKADISTFALGARYDF